MPRLTADRPLAQWQCLNGLIKPHRRRVVAALPPGGITSLGVERPLKGHQYSQYDYDNVQNWLDLLPVYATSAVNIVTESIYDFTPGIISEKTLQAWLGLQVPIIVGHQGIVQQCRDMGFDMFDDVIDNSHDSLPNDQRAEAAVKNNLAVLEQGVQGLDLRLRANQQRVLDWPSQLRGDFFRRAIDIHKTLTKP